MPKQFLDILQVAQSAVANLKVKSALNSLLWFCTPVMGWCMWLLTHTDTQSIQIFLMFVIAVLTLSVIGAFSYFMIFKPDYLRSEEYHIQKSSIELLGEKGRELCAQADHLVLITNTNKESSP